MAEDYKERLRGESNPNYRAAGWIECATCRVVFHSYQPNRQFCSIKCRDVAMPRGRARKDNNHEEIASAIKGAGGVVHDTSQMSRGFPDMIVWVCNSWQLVEVKNPKQTYGRKGLSDLQREWAEKWGGGGVFVIRTVDEAKSLASGDWGALEYVGNKPSKGLPAGELSGILTAAAADFAGKDVDDKTVVAVVCGEESVVVGDVESALRVLKVMA